MRYRDTVALVSHDRILCQLVTAQCEELSIACRTVTPEESVAGVRLVLWDGDCYPVPAEKLPAGAVVIARQPAFFADGELTVWERPFPLSRLRECLLQDREGFTAPKKAAAENTVTVDAGQKCALLTSRDGSVRKVTLTPGECSILARLLEHAREDVSREALSRCLPAEEATGNRVEVHICALRRKLEEASGVRRIFTVRGVGYRFV